jgi:hypothetical protein
VALFSLFGLTLIALLAACDSSGAALSNLSASTNNIVPGSTGIGKPEGVVEVHYTLGSKESVTAMLDGPMTSTLFTGEQDAGDHLLRFDGIVNTSEPSGDAVVVRKVVPAGDYKIVVEAGGMQQSANFSVSPSKQDAPTIQNFVVQPDTISPNGDAVDDVAEATFRTDQTATLQLDLYDEAGTRTPILAPIQKGPGEQNVVINGQDQLGSVLPDGAYTATIRATDSVGNSIQASKPITIEAGGQPDVAILSVDFTPMEIIVGDEISVTIKVKNTGKVPLRTQGPDPGYTYTTNDTYASIDNNQWTDKAGLWRVGVDWDGNSGGGGAYRYPFRWGFGHTLQPGETVVTGGKIRILKQERTMWFYAGLLQEGVRIVLDRLGRTPIHVSF